MLVVGVAWATWHFPLYCLIWRVSAVSYIVSFVTIVGLSFVLSQLFSISNGSVVLPTIFHASWNAAASVITQMQPNYHLHTMLFQLVTVWLTVLVVGGCFEDDLMASLSRTR